MKQQFQKFVKLALFFVYLVIIAGALVRMTGSGMGCPDWPKCFGYIIPPTDIKQLLWKPNHQYNDGQIIIKDEKLLVATGNFKTETLFEEADWRAYTKHDYAIFNATETWIEYLNRLVGALSGVLISYYGSTFFWVLENPQKNHNFILDDCIFNGSSGLVGCKSRLLGFEPCQNYGSHGCCLNYCGSFDLSFANYKTKK